jgi:type VI secretion system protein ImpM
MTTAFAFGKLPSHGDFVARGLDPSAKAAWDEWATSALQSAREALGEDFDAAHDEAPSWCFRIAPGRFGPSWRTGAIAPSIDRSGRRYIFVLGVEAALSDLAAEGFEDLVYRTLAEGLSVDEAVAAAAPILEEEGPACAHFWTRGGLAHSPKDIDAAEPPDDLILLALRRDGTTAA